MRAFILAALAAAAASSSGCSYFVPINHDPDMRCGTLDCGVVVVLPGIEGKGLLNEAICDGLKQGGVPCAIQLWDWTSSVNPLENQRFESINRKKAARIADWIADYRRKYPGRPVFLVGQSGGAAIAAWICESLPPSYNVDGVIMLAASLSPEYPLGTTLSRSRRGVVSFYSSKDWALLGLGTTITGTMDGEHGSSAGKTGFTANYGKLFQIAWTPRMAEAGNNGGHLSSGDARFVCGYVAPLLRESRWTKDLMKKLANGDMVTLNNGDRPGPAVAAATTKPAATAPSNLRPADAGRARPTLSTEGARYESPGRSPESAAVCAMQP